MTVTVTVTLPSQRRAAEDLQALLDGGRARTPAAGAELASLVALAAGLAPALVRPRDGFRSDLRALLVAEASSRPAGRRPAAVVVEENRRASHRVRQAVAAVAVTSVVAGVGAAAASTRALPGDSLYGLKRQVENVQLALARGDVARGRELLEQAGTRLGEAEALAAGQGSTTPATRARLATALTDMESALAGAVTDLTAAYRDTGDAEPMRLLARFLAQQQDRLDDLLPLLGSELRVQLRTLAAQLSDIEQQAMSILGTTAGVASTAPAGGGRDGGSVIDPAAGLPGSTAGAARRAAGQGQRDVAASGPAAIDGVTGVVGAVGGGAGGTSGGPAATGSTGARGGSLPGAGAGTAASTTPLPTAGVPVATPSVPLPLPTGSPGGGGTGPVTGAPPLPSASATPSSPPEVCLPLPPLTTC